MKAAVLLAVIAFAIPLDAQTTWSAGAARYTVSRPELQPSRKALNFAGVGMIVGTAMDLGTTRSLIHRGGVELNPRMGQGAARQAAVGFGATGGLFYLTQVTGDRYPKTSLAVRIGFAASRVLLAVHNSRVKVGGRN